VGAQGDRVVPQLGQRSHHAAQPTAVHGVLFTIEPEYISAPAGTQESLGDEVCSRLPVIFNIRPQSQYSEVWQRFAVMRCRGNSTQWAQLLALIETLQTGDRLIVSELARLGRSLGPMVQIVERLFQRSAHLVATNEAIRFEG
jgi:hypothetical protein